MNSEELNHIRDGWSQIVVGHSTGTAQIRVGAHTWNDSLHLMRSTGNVRIDGAQSFGSNDFSITSGAIDIRNNLTGSGILTLEQGTTTRSLGLGGAGANFRLDASELNRISDGWDHIIIGRNDSTAAANIRAYTWRDDMTIRGGDGQMRFQHTQNFGDNDVTIQSNNLRIDQNFIGTGNLTIEQSDINKSIGLAGGAGDLNLTTTELNRLTDGWAGITIGHENGVGAVALNAYDWNDPATIRRSASDLTNAIEINGSQNSANALTFVGNTNVNVDLTTDGALFFRGVTDLGHDRKIISSGDTVFVESGTSTGLFSLDAEGVSGVFQGEEGLFNANSGAINAKVTFDDLDISGTSATLQAGRIGFGGVVSQEMANLIKINGSLVQGARPNFTFSGFEIGAPPLTEENIPRTIRQTFSTTDIDNKSNKTTTISYIDYSKINRNKNPDGAIYIHPELLKDLKYDPFED